jgi:hypothetical protein
VSSQLYLKPRPLRVALSQYRVVVLKAWTQDALGWKIEDTLDPYDQDEIVSVEARVDLRFFPPCRRDWAVIVLKRQDDESD